MNDILACRPYYDHVNEVCRCAEALEESNNYVEDAYVPPKVEKSFLDYLLEGFKPDPSYMRRKPWM